MTRNTCDTPLSVDVPPTRPYGGITTDGGSVLDVFLSTGAACNTVISIYRKQPWVRDMFHWGIHALHMCHDCLFCYLMACYGIRIHFHRHSRKCECFPPDSTYVHNLGVELSWIAARAALL